MQCPAGADFPLGRARSSGEAADAILRRTLTDPDLAIVLDGGGARAAYQVGFLHAVARELPDLRVSVLHGVSAGAINATWLASRPGSFHARVHALRRLWTQLGIDDVLETRSSRLLWRAVRWATRLGSGGRLANPRGLLDTRPLRAFLHHALESPGGRLPGIAANLASGDLTSLAVTATSYATGQSITFVQGRAIRDWERPMRRSRASEISVSHVLASCALPFLFPAEEVAGEWFGDGGVRLTEPLAPSIHLGARRVLTISTRYPRSTAEADRPAVRGYPPPAQIAGILLNTIFLDALDGDALRLRRINRLLELLPGGDPGGLRPVELRVFRPSEDLGRLASQYESRLPRGLRFLMRGTGSRETTSADLLSLVLFDEDYLGRLVEIGERDAERQIEDVRAFLGAGVGA